MKRSFLFLFSVLALSAGAVPQSRDHTAKMVLVTVPRIALAEGERVGAFQFAVTGGMVASVSNLPKGWYVIVDNDPSWHAQIKGNTTVGAAALTPQEFQQLRFTIEQDETYLSFDVTGTVSATRDFVKEHRVRLKRSDFTVTPQ